MAVDFGKIFVFALRYPFQKDVFLLLLAIQLIFIVPTWFMSGYLIGDISGAEVTEIADVFGRLTSSAVYLAPLMIASWLVTILLMGAYFDNSSSFFSGKAKPLIESLGIAKERFLCLLATIVIITLILIACFGGVFIMLIPALSGGSLVSSPTSFAFLIIGGIWLLVGTIIGIMFLFMTFLSPVFSVLDKKGPMDSIRGSWNLIGKNKLNTFLFAIIYFVIYIIIWMVGTAPEIIFALVAGEIPMFSVSELSFLILRTVFTAYLMLFSYSSYVNYYLSTKKKFGVL